MDKEVIGWTSTLCQEEYDFLADVGEYSPLEHH